MNKLLKVYTWQSLDKHNNDGKECVNNTCFCIGHFLTSSGEMVPRGNVQHPHAIGKDLYQEDISK